MYVYKESERERDDLILIGKTSFFFCEKKVLPFPPQPHISRAINQGIVRINSTLRCSMQEDYNSIENVTA